MRRLRLSNRQIRSNHVPLHETRRPVACATGGREVSDTECPYCKADIEIKHDDCYGYDEGGTYHQECPECRKEFIYYTSIHFSYRTKQADCLNGGEHRWKNLETYMPEFTRRRCEICDDVQTQRVGPP